MKKLLFLIVFGMGLFISNSGFSRDSIPLTYEDGVAIGIQEADMDMAAFRASNPDAGMTYVYKEVIIGGKSRWMWVYEYDHMMFISQLVSSPTVNAKLQEYSNLAINPGTPFYKGLQYGYSSQIHFSGIFD